MEPPPQFQPDAAAPQTSRSVWIVTGGVLLFALVFFIILSFHYRQVYGSGHVKPNLSGGEFTAKSTADGNFRVTFEELKITLDLPSRPEPDRWDPEYSSEELGRWGDRLVALYSWDADVTVWITALWLNKVGDVALQDPQQRRDLATGYRGDKYPGTLVIAPTKPRGSEAISFLNTLETPPLKTYCLYIHHEGAWIEIAVTANEQSKTQTEFNRIVQSIQLN